jgi:hypothetical protein
LLGVIDIPAKNARSQGLTLTYLNLALKKKEIRLVELGIVEGYTTFLPSCTNLDFKSKVMFVLYVEQIPQAAKVRFTQTTTTKLINPEACFAITAMLL